MSKNNNRKIMSYLALAFGMAASTASFAWHQHGGYGGYQHYHGYDDYYNHSWSNGGGGFYFGAGDWGGWGGGPNIVINVPPPIYYAPECQNIEVCNSYGDCWLERACD